MELKRSEDPRTLKINDRQRNRWLNEGLAELFIEKALERINRGQKEHGTDYLKLDTLHEVEEEILDSWDWFVLCAGFKYRVPTEIQDEWFDECIRHWAVFQSIRQRLNNIGVETVPRIANDFISRMNDFVREDTL